MGGYRLQGESLEPREMLAFDPSGIEQAYMESINRMRTDPQGELAVLFSNVNSLTARDSATQAAINFFEVDAQTLLTQWAQLTPVAPVAYNEDLYDAALKHTNLMAQFDSQAHDLPGEDDLGTRIRDEGYSLRRATENIYAFAENHIHGHAGFVIDWGEGPGGIQDPAGHRDNYMDAGVNEVGIAVISESNPSTDVGPFLVTQDFGRRSGYSPQVVGVVYTDHNDNGIYDPGEGLGNVDITVRGSSGTFTTSTLTAGGYQVAVPNGTYEVIASGQGLAGNFVVGNVVMNGANARAEFETKSALQAPVAIADTITLNEDSRSTFVVTPNDQPGSGSIVNNSVTLVQQPLNGMVSLDASGRVTYVPNADFSGNDFFTYTVRDTNGATSNAATVNLIVNNTADAPVISNSFASTATVAEDGQLTISLGAFVTDSDGDIEWNTLAVTTSPTNGQAVVNAAARQIVYTPNPQYNGSDSLAFQVSDSGGRASLAKSLAITVTPVNDRPNATDDVYTAVDRTQATIPVLANDSDPDGSIAGASFQILTPPSTGSAVVNGSNVLITLPNEFVGVVELRYRMQDADGAFSDPATLTLYSLLSESNPWQNPNDRFDVSGDGQVSPIDALLVINRLGEPLSSPAPGVTEGASPFIDVTGDNALSPLDALVVINRLNESDGAASNAALSASATDELFSDDEDESNDDGVVAFWSAG